jgi:hypothetical protein
MASTSKQAHPTVPDRAGSAPTLQLPASESDWQRLRATRSDLGWRLCALAAGLSPAKGLLKVPGSASETYRLLLAAVDANYTSRPSKSKLQYETEPDLATHTALRLSRKEILARNMRYDVRKFAKFLRANPVLEVLVDPVLFKVADEVTAIKPSTPPVAPEPPESSQKRIINNLTIALLGLAVRSYKLHVGGGPKPPNLMALTPVSDEISADLAELGIQLSSDTIAKHLKAATKRVVDEEEEVLSAIHEHYKVKRLT